MTRITAKREARETGLASIGQGPRGYSINVNGKNVADVHAKRVGWEREWSGWVILVFETEKTKRCILKPKGLDVWPLTDEGLEQAKNAALNFIKKAFEQ